jgi:hypothetical protein
MAGAYWKSGFSIHGVMSAKAGIHLFSCAGPAERRWIPAFAGMTMAKLAGQADGF